MQDWAVEVAELSRVGEFIAAYRDPNLTDEDRFLLVQLVVASIEDGLQSEHSLAEAVAWLEATLRRDARLHVATLSYCSVGDDPDPEHQFLITPLLREIWKELRDGPGLVLAD